MRKCLPWRTYNHRYSLKRNTGYHARRVTTRVASSGTNFHADLFLFQIKRAKHTQRQTWLWKDLKYAFLCVHRSALALFPSSRKQAWKSSEPVRVCYFGRYTVRHCYGTAAPLSACGLMPECSLFSATKAIPLEKVSSSSFNASAATPRNSLSFSCASCFLVRKKRQIVSCSRGIRSFSLERENNKGLQHRCT